MGATHGNKTTVAWNGHVIGEVTAIGDVNITADTVDATTFNAPDFFKKYIRGLLDAGEIPITCNFDLADTDGQVAYAADFYAGTERTLTIAFPMGASWSLPALPVGLGTAQPVDDKISLTITVKPNGKPALAFTASDGLTAPFFAISESAVVTPTPAGGVYSYVATVLTGVTSVTVTPTALAGVITVNGNVVASGQASSAIMLGEAGTNTSVTIVVTEAGKSPKTYKITVARAA